MMLRLNGQRNVRRIPDSDEDESDSDGEGIDLHADVVGLPDKESEGEDDEDGVVDRVISVDSGSSEDESEEYSSDSSE